MHPAQARQSGETGGVALRTPTHAALRIGGRRMTRTTTSTTRARKTKRTRRKGREKDEEDEEDEALGPPARDHVPRRRG